MAVAQDLKKVVSSTCGIKAPTPDSNIHDFVSRWSDAGVSLPFAVVTPSSTSDITSTIKFASQNDLKIVPANGGHASFLSITSRSIYLDMSQFKNVHLDEGKQEVTIGGGCISADVLKVLSPKGWYTLTPNSNAVGMIGAFLGGLSHAMNGVHGFGIDHVREIKIIPFSNPSPSSGDLTEVVLTPESKGEEKKLFNVLCGAGHGLGIVTSITLKAWKISDLGMTQDKIWTRKLIFPALAIEAAAQLYSNLFPPPPELTTVLGFLRAPPSAPKPGAPMILLSCTYFGSKEYGEKVCKTVFEEKYVSKAMMNVSTLVEWEKMNEASEPMNRHGGIKEYHGCFVEKTNSESIVKSFEAWKDFTDADIKGRGASYVVIGSWSTDKLVENAGGKDEKFFPARDRGIFVQATPWYDDIGVKGEADGFGKSVVSCMREVDIKALRKDWCFVNNLISGQDMREVYHDEQVEEIKRTKEIWDTQGLGWSPVIEE